MNKKHCCLFKRFAALVASLLMVCCITAPALASNNWPASPSESDFVSHSGSWYVWQKKTISGYSGFELICSPMFENQSTNTLSSIASAWVTPYSTSSRTYAYTSVSGETTTFMYSIPYIPLGFSGFWSDLPSFPVGEPSKFSAVVRLYPSLFGFYSNVSDVFSNKDVYAFLTSWPSSGNSSIGDYFANEIFDTFPVYIPSNIFFFGSRTNTSNNHTSFTIVDGDNVFWCNPFNTRYLGLNSSHLSNASMTSFPSSFTIPSSEIGFVFAKDVSSSGVITNNSLFDVSNLIFSASLWVPDALLPADVKVGDWISKADVESLQNQLVKDFDVNSDTLKNSKQNFDSWQNSNTIDSDVAHTGLDIINGLLQNVGQFAFIVSLLCFGAVVLRVLIRKAVEG